MAAAAAVPPNDVEFDRSCGRCGGPHGKPTVHRPDRGLEVSLSHSGDRVAVAVGMAGAVGVDVEQIDRRVNPTELARVILSISEQAELDRLPEHERWHGLLRYWTRKEAVLKATGDGLSIAPSTLMVSAPDRAPSLMSPGPIKPATSIHLADIDPDDAHVACLAVLADHPPRIVQRDGTALLSSLRSGGAVHDPAVTPQP